MTPRSEDPALEEVRAARRAISEECGHDLSTLVARYVAMQQAQENPAPSAATTKPLQPSA